MDQASELRQRIRESKTAGVAMSRDDVALAVAWIGEARAGGMPVSRVASALGVSEVTIYRWLRRSTPVLRAVEVVPEPSRRAFTVISPNGLRVEGLALAEVKSLLGVGA